MESSILNVKGDKMKVVFTKQEVIALARAASTYETLIGKAKYSKKNSKYWSYNTRCKNSN